MYIHVSQIALTGIYPILLRPSSSSLFLLATAIGQVSDRWMDGWMNGWMDGWIDGWLDR